MGLDLELERNKEFVLVERKKSIPGWRRARKKDGYRNNWKLCDYVVIISYSFFSLLVSGAVLYISFSVNVY